MITKLEAVTLSEAAALSEDVENKNLSDYFKKFSKLSKDKAIKMREELRALGYVKLNEATIVKLVDFMPKDAEEVHKIASDVSLDEKETNAIIDIVGKY